MTKRYCVTGAWFVTTEHDEATLAAMMKEDPIAFITQAEVHERFPISVTVTETSYTPARDRGDVKSWASLRTHSEP